MKVIVFASVLATVLSVSGVQAQVAQLGRLPIRGQVAQASFCAGGCDDGCDGGCAVEPGCGVAEPSCGLAGKLLSGGHGLFRGGLLAGMGGGPSCGMPDPSCGSVGLGYSGGFGLSAGDCGDCNSCGSGGYLGRNLHQVNPCACGGSLIGDFARGLFQFVDRAVGTLVGGVFGGLQSITCHASGTFAALQCAAQASCDSCGGLGCADGCAIDPGCGIAVPGCGVASPACGCPVEGYGANTPAYGAPAHAQVEGTYLPEFSRVSAPMVAPVQAAPSMAPLPTEASNSGVIETFPMDPVPNSQPIQVEPIQTDPIQFQPMQEAPMTDPFQDDPVSTSQAPRQPKATATGFRFYNPRSQKDPATRQYSTISAERLAQQQQLVQRRGVQLAQQPKVVQRTVRTATSASRKSTAYGDRYLHPQKREATFRR